MKANSKGKFEVKYLFLKPLSQNFETLTTRGDVINPKMGLKGPNWNFIINSIERWKSKVKGTLTWIIRLWNRSLKIFNSKVLTQSGDIINPKLTWNRAQTCISCTNGVRKMKIKSKRIGSKRPKFVYHIQLAVKISKSGAITLVQI